MALRAMRLWRDVRPAGGRVTSDEAIQIALDAGEPHETSEYRITAVATGENMLSLKLVRVIGLAERAQLTHVTFNKTGHDRDMFKQQCARAWQWLVDQHRLSRQETGI